MNVIYHHRTRCQGAEGVHIRGIQKALRQSGFNVYDISMVKADDDVGEKSKSEEMRDSLKRKLFSLICDIFPNIIFKCFELFYSIRAIIFGWIAINKITRNNQFVDVVYDRYAYFCFAMPFICKMRKIPLILEVNTTCLDSDVRGMKLRFVAKYIEKYCFNNATLIVVVSNYLKCKIHQHYVIDPKRIIVTPNAVDPEMFCLEIRQQNPQGFLKKAVAFSENKLVIGFVGVFVPWHGIELLIDVFKELVHHFAEEIEVGLLLVGDGPVRREVEDKIESDPSLRDRVLITGMVAHDFVKYYIDLFDIAIMPDSNPFGSPMKVFEYMIMGKPIVVPSYSPIEEVITHNVNGLVFKKRDNSDCFEKLLSLVLSQKLRRKLGGEAKRIAETRYTWQANINKIIIRLKELTEK